MKNPITTIDENIPFEKNVWNIINNLQETIIFISKQYDDTLLELKKIREENTMLKKAQDLQQSTIENLVGKCEELDIKINDFEQEKIKNVVNITGLPNLNTEDIKKKIIEIGNECDVQINMNDIIDIHKLENKKTELTTLWN